MSADNDAPVPHELVIVRRRVGFEEEGHHGGAWKIAFADLMTAMMTFFLVMWLINISDQDKIVRIATYFNPTKLSEKLPSKKGVYETKGDDEPKGADPEAKIQPEDKLKSDPTEKKEKAVGEGVEQEGDPQKAEEELFNDPYGVLARMALKALSRGEKANGGTMDGEEMLPGGEAYRNPFEPFAADQPLVAPEATLQEQEKEVKRPAEATPEQAAQAPAAEAAAAAPAAGKESVKDDLAAAKNLEKEIKDSLSTIGPEGTPNVEVERVDEGILVSLTDDFRFGMFGVSSSVPKPELVVAMEKIAKVLATREGGVVIRGHTDGRPFKSGKNDNWRLSMSRAQVAYYMLVRGGLEESRVERIEGHADRTLKIPGDPNAAQNRRIEILLKVQKT